MTVNLWPERVTWSQLPASQQRKVMIHLGRLIQRCLADPQRTGSREAAHDPADRCTPRQDPPRAS
jgi:predicted Fe-S protein YdhL (DUF1289 family)